MNARIRRVPMALITIAIISACTPGNPEIVAYSIYTGGAIVTANDAQPAAEAVAVKEGKILAVGSPGEIEKSHKGANR